MDQQNEERHAESRALELYRERITRIETQVEIVTVRQGQLQSVVGNQTELLKETSKQIT